MTNKTTTERGYWHMISIAIAELDAQGFITERTQARLTRHDIDPVQVHLGWSDVETKVCICHWDRDDTRKHFVDCPAR